jgi:exonuclease VII small subunit
MIDKDAKGRLFNEAMALLDRIEEMLDATQRRLEKAAAELHKNAA